MTTTPTAFEAMRSSLEALWPMVQSYINDHVNPRSTVHATAQGWVDFSRVALAQAEAELQGEKPARAHLEARLHVVTETLRQFVHAHKSWDMTDENWNALILDADKVLHAIEAKVTAPPAELRSAEEWQQIWTEKVQPLPCEMEILIEEGLKHTRAIQQNAIASMRGVPEADK